LVEGGFAHSNFFGKLSAEKQKTPCVAKLQRWCFVATAGMSVLKGDMPTLFYTSVVLITVGIVAGVVLAVQRIMRQSSPEERYAKLQDDKDAALRSIEVRQQTEGAARGVAPAAKVGKAEQAGVSPGGAQGAPLGGTQGKLTRVDKREVAKRRDGGARVGEDAAGDATGAGGAGGAGRAGGARAESSSGGAARGALARLGGQRGAKAAVADGISSAAALASLGEEEAILLAEMAAAAAAAAAAAEEQRVAQREAAQLRAEIAEKVGRQAAKQASQRLAEYSVKMQRAAEAEEKALRRPVDMSEHCQIKPPVPTASPSKARSPSPPSRRSPGSGSPSTKLVRAGGSPSKANMYPYAELLFAQQGDDKTHAANSRPDWF
jgi:hypothetical protein